MQALVSKNEIPTYGVETLLPGSDIKIKHHGSWKTYMSVIYCYYNNTTKAYYTTISHYMHCVH